MKRINWLDTTRGLAFLMVIYCHLDYCDSQIMRFFSPVFLTMFFFVSGYLFKENWSFSKVFEQRTRTILLPFLIWGSVLILTRCVLTFKDEQPSVAESFLSMLLQDGANRDLWFVAALYTFSIVFYWVLRWCGSGTKLLVVCTILFILNTVYDRWLHGPFILWYVHLTGYGCFYMGLGKWYRQREEKVNKIASKWLVWLALVVYVAYIYIFDFHVSYGSSNLIVDAIFITLIGIFAMTYLCKWYAGRSKFLLYVGANSLLYFVLHGKCFMLLQTILSKVLEMTDISLSYIGHDIMGFVITFLDALILIIPVWLVNRYVPQTLGRGFHLWKSKE